VDEVSGARRARLLVLGAGPAQLGLLEAARERGLDVVAADADPEAPGFALADERALISSEDEVAVGRLARARQVDGVISPGGDWPVGIAARVARRLGIPHPVDGETAALATSKARQRERFAAEGVPQPRVFALDDPELVFPVVVKPPDRQGQRGVSVVRHPHELAAAIVAAVEASRSGAVIAEEHVEGAEVTVNAVSHDGRFLPLTVTDRELAAMPAFGVALAHEWPSAHDVDAAVETARAAVAALGIRNGPSYTQLRLTPDGARVLEVAARLGGGHDAELCLAVLGIDLNDLALSFALGEAPSDDQLRGTGARAGGGCVRFLVAPQGTLVAVEGVDEACAGDGVQRIRVYRRPGHPIGPLRTGADRAGAVLAVGVDREEARTRARRAAQAVRFHVDAHPS
jgi:biotin carboxylase